MAACGAETEQDPYQEGNTGVESQPLTGSVGVYLFSTTEQGHSQALTALTASFEGDILPECQQSFAGGCTRTDCAWAEHGQEATHRVTAGRITASSGERTLSVQPSDNNGPYPAHFEPISLWEQGSSITIQASGGDIEPFSAEVKGPDQTLVVDPNQPSPDASLLIERGQPLFITWNEVEAGKLLSVLSYQGETGYGVISCRFPAQEGGGDIPARLLADFDTEEAPMRLSLGVGHSTTVQAGKWEIEVTAYTNAVTDQGLDASFNAVFQAK